MIIHSRRLYNGLMRNQGEAGDEHSQDLQRLRAESQATIEQLRAAHSSTVENIKAQAAAALEDQVKTLEKQISTLELELKATKDDLAKAKAAHTEATAKAESLTTQLEEARKQAEVITASAPSDQSADVERLTRELINARDDHAALTDVLAVTKDSLSEMSNNHAKELEEAAKGRAEEATRLKAAHAEEAAAFAREKSDFIAKVSDLEGELATLKATMAAQEAASPKTNGVAQPLSPGVTKEELQKLHEAHTLKIRDLQAAHEKGLQALKDELEAAQSREDELKQDVARKAMELQYIEQEQDEGQEEITRYALLSTHYSWLTRMLQTEG